MIYALPWLKLTNGRFAKCADQPFDFSGQRWQRWSRHQEQWRLGIDGIWTMLRRIDTALAEAA
jgi:Prokaryotic E2 family E